jgi:hypothetical protein
MGLGVAKSLEYRLIRNILYPARDPEALDFGFGVSSGIKLSLLGGLVTAMKTRVDMDDGFAYKRRSK